MFKNSSLFEISQLVLGAYIPALLERLYRDGAAVVDLRWLAFPLFLEF
jgi:hypothetical protein